MLAGPLANLDVCDGLTDKVQHLCGPVWAETCAIFENP